PSPSTHISCCSESKPLTAAYSAIKNAYLGKSYYHKLAKPPQPPICAKMPRFLLPRLPRLPCSHAHVQPNLIHHGCGYSTRPLPLTPHHFGAPPIPALAPIHLSVYASLWCRSQSYAPYQGYAMSSLNRSK